MYKNEEKKPFEAPQVEVIRFETEDIITTSITTSGDDNELGNWPQL